MLTFTALAVNNAKGTGIKGKGNVYKLFPVKHYEVYKTKYQKVIKTS